MEKATIILIYQACLALGLFRYISYLLREMMLKHLNYVLVGCVGHHLPEEET